MATVIIKRKSKMLGCLAQYNVYLNDTYVGKLKNGTQLEFQAYIGTHTLFFKNTLSKIGKDETFTVYISDFSEIITLNCAIGTNGRLNISYADGKPHFPPQTQTSTTSYNHGITCKRCGSPNLMPISEVSSKGKDFNAGDACCGALLCGPLGLLCGASGKGRQISSTVYWICKDCGKKFKA